MPTISVIVPVYKVEPYLRRCVDSVLAQSFSDFEVILVDDGSPDSCGTICDEYAGKDARVHVIHKENGGLSSARNAGLAAAQGELICFVDSDDFIDPEELETAVQEIDGFDMVCWGFRQVDENGAVCLAGRISPGVFRWENAYAQFAFLLKQYFPYRIGWAAWSRLYRKRIIDRYGLSFEDNRKIFAEDLYFSLIYLLHARSVCCLDDVYYNYFVRSDSIMGEQWTQYNFGRMVELAKAVDRHLAAQDDLPLMREKSAVFFFEILNNVITRARKNDPTLDVRRLRALLYEEITDRDFFRSKCSELLRHRKDLELGHGFVRSLEIVSEYRYYLDGRYAAWYIRRLPLRLLRRAQRVKKALHR